MKYSLALLPAATQAVASGTKGSLGTNWPKFGSTNPASIANTILTPDASNAGDKWLEPGVGYYAFRCNTLYVAPQNINASFAPIAFGTSDPVRALYQFKTAPTVFTQAGIATGSGALNNPGAGKLHLNCSPNDNGAKQCAGGISHNTYASGAAGATVIATRIVVNNANTWTAFKTVASGTANYVTGTYMTSINTDLIMGSLWHKADLSSGANTGAWCSKYYVKLTAGTDSTLSAKVGFANTNKCGWQIAVSDGTFGPQFQLDGAVQSTDVIIQYIEFWNALELGTQGEILDKATDQATYYPGIYAETDGQISLNPLVTAKVWGLDTATSNTDTKFNWDSIYGTDFPAGSIGYIAQHNDNKQINRYDSGSLLSTYSSINAAIGTYTTAKTTYEGQVSSYNTLAQAWNTDKSTDIMSAVRSIPSSLVGQMYCPEGIPKIDITMATDWDSTNALWISSPYNTAPAQQGTFGDSSENYYKNALVGSSWAYNKAGQAKKTASAQGYLVMAPAVSATTTHPSVGHSFGRLGQGAAAMPANAKPYVFIGSTAPATTDAPRMLVNVFPNSGVVAFTGTQVINFKAKEAKWATQADFAPASCPGAPTSMTVLGAQQLAASVLAAATVAYTLY